MPKNKEDKPTYYLKCEKCKNDCKREMVTESELFYCPKYNTIKK
jgi:hypothetical protein